MSRSLFDFAVDNHPTSLTSGSAECPVSYANQRARRTIPARDIDWFETGGGYNKVDLWRCRIARNVAPSSAPEGKRWFVSATVGECCPRCWPSTCNMSRHLLWRPPMMRPRRSSPSKSGREGSSSMWKWKGSTATLRTHCWCPPPTWCGCWVEVVGFSDGVPYSVMVDHVLQPDGQRQKVVFADRRMAARCTAFSKDDVGRVVSMAASDLRLARALSDLMMSLSIPHYSPISCGRVAEAILNLLTGSKGPAAWAEMRSVPARRRGIPEAADRAFQEATSRRSCEGRGRGDDRAARTCLDPPESLRGLPPR